MSSDWVLIKGKSVVKDRRYVNLFWDKIRMTPMGLYYEKDIEMIKEILRWLEKGE